MASFPVCRQPIVCEDSYTTHSERHMSLLQVSVKSLHVISQEELVYFTAGHLDRGVQTSRLHFRRLVLLFSLFDHKFSSISNSKIKKNN